MRQQCRLLGINRSSVYYQPKLVSVEELAWLRLIDEVYTQYPFFARRQMTAYLQLQGYSLTCHQVRKAYATLGLQSTSPGPRTTQREPAHPVYPYLLRNEPIVAVNPVWSSDITYCRLRQGFAYLVAIIDWFSRYVLGWQLSISLEADFCIETLERVLAQGSCLIFNTDQGSQFTCKGFTDLLLAQGIRISMDGKGRALDNIFVERLWRTVKYECIYLQE